VIAKTWPLSRAPWVGRRDGASLCKRLIASTTPYVIHALPSSISDPCSSTVLQRRCQRVKVAGSTYGQEENLNDASRVWKLKFPLVGMYWLTYQKVQSSEGSMTISV